MIEEWRDIKGYEGYYMISSMGRVKSLKRRCIVKGEISREVCERIMKLNTYTMYAKVSLNKNSEIKIVKVHVLMALVFFNYKNDPKNDTVIDHINNDKRDNRIVNLQLISARENYSKDRFRRKLSSKYLGVYWSKFRSRWVAVIVNNKVRQYLGVFKNEIDASNAYQKALKQILS